MNNYKIGYRVNFENMNYCHKRIIVVTLKVLKEYPQGYHRNSVYYWKTM
ncbi:MAG: hypothetical protein Q4G05_04665 [Clostridia bacterium]|nr:hypothetical protein [Clostridia bacterium]